MLTNVAIATDRTVDVPRWREVQSPEIAGSSEALGAVLDSVKRVAPTDVTVLITGETGTGKELIARAIHEASARSAHRFVSVNCAAIPQSLIGSELFGHERGAFTGALQRRLGRFEMAAGGTLFLDEVGELPLETQIALLRVLQEREFERVGGSSPIPANVRVLAATNRDLEITIAAGTFRSDLYYRLNVFPIAIPPLRERKEDILPLVKLFVERHVRREGKAIPIIPERTAAALEAYGWPGNVRELQNVIERSMILCDSGVLSIADSSVRWKSHETTAGDPTLAEIQREAIVRALHRSEWRVGGAKGAAAALDVPRTTLQARMRKLGIAHPRSRRRVAH